MPKESNAGHWSTNMLFSLLFVVSIVSVCRNKVNDLSTPKAQPDSCCVCACILAYHLTNADLLTSS